MRHYQEAFPKHAEVLAQREPEYFHLYAFNTLRQLGANFELLASFLGWLGGRQDIDFAAEIDAANAIAGGAKAFQFQLARAVARNRLPGLEAHLDPLITSYDTVFSGLLKKVTPQWRASAA